MIFDGNFNYVTKSELLSRSATRSTSPQLRQAPSLRGKRRRFSSLRVLDLVNLDLDQTEVRLYLQRLRPLLQICQHEQVRCGHYGRIDQMLQRRLHLGLDCFRKQRGRNKRSGLQSQRFRADGVGPGQQGEGGPLRRQQRQQHRQRHGRRRRGVCRLLRRWNVLRLRRTRQ
jgi:hypothetical protein